MAISLQELGDQIRAAREDRRLSQPQVKEALNLPNRSVIAHLEQGRRLASPELLQQICEFLNVPAKYWKPFTHSEYAVRTHFEEAVSELIGHPVTLRFHDDHSTAVAQDAIISLFNTDLTDAQARDALNSILVYYDIPAMSAAFFAKYFGEDATKSTQTLLTAVRRFQAEAIRVFSTFTEAYHRMNEPDLLDYWLAPLMPRKTDEFRGRRPWDCIETIPEEWLPDLGYISVAKARQEVKERKLLSEFLNELAMKIEAEGKSAINGYSQKKRIKMGSLLRQFQSKLQHDLMSSLFSPDPDAIRREAQAIAPKHESDLERIEQTQDKAQRNLARYLAADYLDVYVATSMRSNADFVSVSKFSTQLFQHDALRPLKLRYFNPTQSYIEDRVAKGLVEALMLRRSSMTIYMAQKVDTFGKDSEASVALGQGKPVVVYVPRLFSEQGSIDSDELGRKERSDLERLVAQEGDDEDKEVDPTVDKQSLLGRIITIRLRRVSEAALTEIVRQHWADFDLYGETSRIEDTEERAEYRAWLDVVTAKDSKALPALSSKVVEHVIGVLVAVAVNFEKRAELFREQHPLALQVILSTGVLNGIHVARSVSSCAELMSALIRNELQLELVEDEDNYRLVEKTTGSTIRVISRHTLIVNAFSAFYARNITAPEESGSGPNPRVSRNQAADLPQRLEAWAKKKAPGRNPEL
jgi:transcriptional regulator with XRE-family HTH domain